MRKLTFLFVVIVLAGSAKAQQYNNEWIDYTKTYYKIKIAAAGAYRISAGQLGTIGLGSTAAEAFQLWRNGKQVPIFTSVATGSLGTSGYIEFWGEANDGSLDRELYRLPTMHISDKISLQTDTSVYFLTVNPGSGNLRFITTNNNVAGNTRPKEPYFIHSIRNNFRDRINPGLAVYAGVNLYSSVYDTGEMFSSQEIYSSSPLSVTFNNLSVATTGPAATFRAAVAGASFDNRNYEIGVNTSVVKDTSMSGFSAAVNVNAAIPLSAISSNSAVVKITNKSTSITDRIVCGFIELNYPRLFSFNNEANFTFQLPASNTERYLEIADFAAGGQNPVLYDLTNNRRYVADITTPGLVKIVIQPSSVTSSFVLVSAASANVKNVTSFTPRVFVNYDESAYQGDYLIISNPFLETIYNGNDQVELYRAYRASAAGGNYSAKVFNIGDLVDQFAFGVKKHPLSIKNFLRYARDKFKVTPKFAFMIGKGISYNDYRTFGASPEAERLNLVPTWGYPASDILLASNTMDPYIATPIGRLSAITPQEVAIYLEKVVQYEQAQADGTQTINAKAWMKNVIHVTGANDPSLDASLSSHLRAYENVIENKQFGGTVTSFNKSSTGPVTPIVSSLMEQKFEQGVSLLTYFGHSSATALDYNLDDPAAYNNTGKYPMFLVLGCSAGNLYSYDVSRFSVISTLSERFVLAKAKGSIGFIASTSFGIESYLDSYTRRLYNSMSVSAYGKSIGENMKEVLSQYVTSFYSFFTYIHAEQTILHGDPAIKLNNFSKPDYTIENAQISINPNIVSVADDKFTVKANIFNIGRATDDSLSVKLTREYPDGTTGVIFQNKIKGVSFTDSIVLEIPIIATRDKGANKITVSVDDGNLSDEINETNNVASVNFIVLEDEIRPAFPYNYYIVNKSNVKLTASTANPLSASRQYTMELDTTELFSSPFKITRNVTAAGGIVEFDAATTFRDSTVYYWRVSPVLASGEYRWNSSSFIFLNGSSAGFNQSHYNQHTKSNSRGLFIDSASRQWRFSNNQNQLTIVNSVFGQSGTGDSDFSIAVNGLTKSVSACLGHSVIFNVFDPVTLKQLYNQPQPSVLQSGSPGGFMNSAAFCLPGREFNFEFSYLDTIGRRRMRDFMDWIPAGYIVTARLILDPPYDQTPFASVWKNDELIYGAGNTVYSRLQNAGFANIDSFSYARTWAFIYRKNNNDLAPASIFSNGLFDKITINLEVNSSGTNGAITSPLFGPAVAWKQIKWRGSNIENSGDDVYVTVLGITTSGQEDSLYRLNVTNQDFDISAVSTTRYPYMKLRLSSTDEANLTPYQLRYWRLLYDPVPEGAIAPNLLYAGKDTLEVGEPLRFSIAFKNISDATFRDSIRVSLIISDKNNVANALPINRKVNLAPGDSTSVRAEIDTRNLSGNNTLFVEFNPANDQPEQQHSNNFLYKNFFIKPDTYNPLMDVTFDGVHILNGDIVSARPKILIKLKDEARYLALDDTSLASVSVRFPGSNGVTRHFSFGTDTLRFIPADVSTGKNEAMIEFSPAFLEDSDGAFYELILSGKDKSGNTAGNIEYRVRFQVYTKPMISNMFNYPNPFTTSTAFVFTITGSQVPQNIRIQIMTVTGKIIKDITKEELGDLHIGRNITNYKWDGTDQYGQKLANGIYLYRVITNLNGNSLEKFNTLDANGDNISTDKYFNKGYGKMYLMR